MKTTIQFILRALRFIADATPTTIDDRIVRELSELLEIPGVIEWLVAHFESTPVNFGSPGPPTSAPSDLVAAAEAKGIPWERVLHIAEVVAKLLGLFGAKK